LKRKNKIKHILKIFKRGKIIKMYKNKSVLALIPARRESKSLPRKNIKPLGGRPLISYTIGEALSSRYIDRVIVSTEDKEISDIAIRYGAEVPFLRPKNLAKDTASSLSVILHTLDYLKREEKHSPEIIVFLQPTSPFRRVEHIDEGIKKIEECDAVVGVYQVRQHPYFMMQQKGELLIPYLKIKNRPLRRQDVPNLYCLNASLYITKREYYDKVKKNDPVVPIFGGKVRGVFMDEISSIDINDYFDFLFAEFIISSNFIKGKNNENNENN